MLELSLKIGVGFRYTCQTNNGCSYATGTAGCRGGTSAGLLILHMCNCACEWKWNTIVRYLRLSTYICLIKCHIHVQEEEEQFGPLLVGTLEQHGIAATDVKKLMVSDCWKDHLITFWSRDIRRQDSTQLSPSSMPRRRSLWRSRYWKLAHNFYINLQFCNYVGCERTKGW